MANMDPGASNVQPGERDVIMEFLKNIHDSYKDLKGILRGMSIDTVEELLLATKNELVNAGIPEFKARVLLSRAQKAAAAPAPAPAFDDPRPLDQWACFRDVSRAESLALLAGQFNTYMLRKSSLFPNDANVYVVTVCYLDDQSPPQPKFSHLIIAQRVSQERGREYMYVTEMLFPEAGSATWSTIWFGSVHAMIKARFPGIVGPALLQSQQPLQDPRLAERVLFHPLPKAGGGHRRKTKKSNRTSRHKHTKKRKCTVRRKQTRLTRH